jgi:O-antigen chain-terminating methyltransferase
VVEADIIHFLRAQKPNTLGAITGFHIVEHLPLKILTTLFDESLGLLRPGGILIFETPNPENLVVGACNFYIDPTHKNPLPPITLQYIAKERGFINTEILRLHKNESQVLENELLQRLLFGEQDYAVIGYKP